MRVCTCAACVATAASLVLPPTDHRSHDPHTHTPSPTEQVPTFGNVTVASSTSTALAARVVLRSWTTTPEGLHVFRLR